MNFLNIGLPELFFVLVIMLIFLGPDKLQENSRSLARWVRKIVRSETWRTFMGVYKEVKEYPTQVMKDVEFEELSKTLQNEVNDIQRLTESEIKNIGKEIDTVLEEQEAELKKIDQDLEQLNQEIRSIEPSADDCPGMPELTENDDSRSEETLAGSIVEIPLSSVDARDSDEEDNG